MTNNINSYDLLFLTNKEYSKHIEKKMIHLLILVVMLFIIKNKLKIKLINY